MRNPLNSWDRSDSFIDPYLYFIIGPKDMELAKKLVLSGPEHAKFLRQIMVSVDITAPLYWWKEFDTYKVGTVANSCSTMHKIHSKEFTADDFSFKNTLGVIGGEELVNGILDNLNSIRDIYNNFETLSSDGKLDANLTKKQAWYTMIELLPSAYNQKRTVTMSYANLRNIYLQRKNHKLSEWNEEFIKWIETLPYAKELIKLEDK